MQIKQFSDFMLPSLAGFMVKNRNEFASMLPGTWMKIFISENQIKGLMKDKMGNKTRLRKVIIKTR